jgi:hypothetical protein
MELRVCISCRQGTTAVGCYGECPSAEGVIVAKIRDVPRRICRKPAKFQTGKGPYVSLESVLASTDSPAARSKLPH